MATQDKINKLIQFTKGEQFAALTPEKKRQIGGVITKAQESIKNQGKTILDVLSPEIPQAQREKHPYWSAIADTAKEASVAPLHFANTALLNQPRALSEKFGLGFPEAETLPGQILSKGAGVAGLLANPLTKALGPLGKGGGLIKQGLVGAGKGAVTGFAWAPKDIADLGTRLRQGGVGAGIGGAFSGIGGALGKIKNLPKDKVLAIRKGAKGYRQEEMKAYGKMLDSLAESGDEVIEASPAMEKLTKMMVDRGLYDPARQKWITPLNKVDRQLVKSYEGLYRKMQQQGNKLSTKDVFQELRNIKNSGGSFRGPPTEMTRNSLSAQQEILQSIKPQIKSEAFQQGNARYSEFKNNLDAIDKHFKIFESDILTERGERFLTTGLGRSGEAREIAKTVTEKTGQTLRGGKAASFANQALRNPLVRALLLGGALGTGGFLGSRKGGDFGG